MLDKGEWSKVKWIAEEQNIDSFDRMEAKRLDAELRQEAKLQQPEVNTTEEGKGSETGPS